MLEPTFRFKQFAVTDRRCGMKLGTDGVVLGALAAAQRPDGRFADIGAGCGIIGLMLAQRYAKATIDFIELDSGAADDLRENVAASPWSERLNVVNFDFALNDGVYDLIVSNPPYFPDGVVAPDSSRALARSGGAGLSVNSLIAYAPHHLCSGGRLAIIMPIELADGAEYEAVLQKLNLCRRVDVATSQRRGFTRTFMEFSKDDDSAPVYSRLNLNSDEYIELVKDFYLKI